MDYSWNPAKLLPNNGQEWGLGGIPEVSVVFPSSICYASRGALFLKLQHSAALDHIRVAGPSPLGLPEPPDQQNGQILSEDESSGLRHEAPSRGRGSCLGGDPDRPRMVGPTVPTVASGLELQPVPGLIGATRCGVPAHAGDRFIRRNAARTARPTRTIPTIVVTARRVSQPAVDRHLCLADFVRSHESSWVSQPKSPRTRQGTSAAETRADGRDPQR